MLTNMHIKNIVLIDEIDIDFSEGLNILTGETGAGKSVIIGSLGICMGGKFGKELLRDPEKDGLVELTFSVEEPHVKRGLSALDVEAEDGELVISRVLSENGRTKNRINGMTVTTALLKEVAALLIDLHAQHEQQTLLKPHKHLQILDEFGKDKIDPLKEKTAQAYSAFLKAEEALASASMDEGARAKRLDYLEYQIREIEEAKLVPGEDEELEAYYKRAEHAREITENLSAVSGLIGYDTPNACGEQLSRAAERLKRVEALDEKLGGYLEQLTQVDAMLSDINRELSDYIGGLDFDERTLEQTEQRLNTINGLKLKYGQMIEEILKTYEDFCSEKEQLEAYDTYMETLSREYEEKKKALEDACEALHLAREKKSVSLVKIIREALLELNFMQVEFDMEFARTEGFTADGNDHAVFMISTNVGEPMRPLHEIASGGELSRVMLAVKSCLAGKEDTPTLVFDEIDVGISGKTAQAVAERLSVIAKAHQVLCITHLPQIAAKADSHYEIEKHAEEGKTVTNIRRLDAEASVRELARLLTGETLTETALSHARELIEQAKK